MNLVRIKIEPGQEVIEKIHEECALRGIRDAAIVSIIGAVDSCRIHNMKRDDPMAPVKNDYHEHFEMSGSGEITNGKAHIHCVMSREGEVTAAGHLHWARVEHWFVLVFIAPER